jgi:hypothetical protein
MAEFWKNPSYSNHFAVASLFSLSVGVLFLAAFIADGQLAIVGPTGPTGTGGFLNFATAGLTMNDPCKKFLDNANSTGLSLLVYNLCL